MRETSAICGIFAHMPLVSGSKNRQLLREYLESLRPHLQKFPFLRRPLAEINFDPTGWQVEQCVCCGFVRWFFTVRDSGSDCGTETDNSCEPRLLLRVSHSGCALEPRYSLTR